MTSIEAYILAKKIALGAVSNIKNITFNDATKQIVFNFNNGTSSGLTVPMPKDGEDGEDGLSVVNIEIDANNHLICTLSDGSTIDAGALPDKSGGGLIQANKLSDLPQPGSDDTIYLTLDEEVLYYWDNKTRKYCPISGGPAANGIEFKTGEIVFDDTSQTFELPIDNKTVSIYINGVYQTEDIDYTIDRTVTPNKVTFEEVWETTDSCTVVWVKGKVDEEEVEPQPPASVEVGIPQLKEDIASIFNSFVTIDEEDIDSPWPEQLTLASTKISPLLTDEQKSLVRSAYILNDSNKMVGIGYVAAYDKTADTFTFVLTKFGEGSPIDIDISLAETTDIDNLFPDEEEPEEPPTKPDISVSFAKPEDIDNLFNDEDLETPDTSMSLATERDIDNLFEEGI